MKTRLFFVALVLLSTSCASQRSSQNTKTENQLTVASVPPFSTKEPERYQATRTITTSIQGNVVVRKVMIARDGQLRREEYFDPDLPNIVYLYLPAGTTVIGPSEKIFSEVGPGAETTPASATDQLESSTDQLTLLDSVQTSYERLGPDSVNGRSAIKYRVVVNRPDSPTVSTSESVIWIDDALGMPIKSEAKSANGNYTTMELLDLKLEVAASLFQVPEGFQKVEIVELRRRLKR